LLGTEFYGVSRRKRFLALQFAAEHVAVGGASDWRPKHEASDTQKSEEKESAEVEVKINQKQGARSRIKRDCQNPEVSERPWH